jgi:hypothetical protein
LVIDGSDIAYISSNRTADSLKFNDVWIVGIGYGVKQAKIRFSGGVNGTVETDLSPLEVRPILGTVTGLTHPFPIEALPNQLIYLQGSYLDHIDPFEWNVLIDGVSVEYTTLMRTPNEFNIVLDLTGYSVGTHTIELAERNVVINNMQNFEIVNN